MGHDLSHQGNDGQHHHDTSGDVPETRDPACGMTVDPATAKHRTLVGDGEYFFCSSGCMGKVTATKTRAIMLMIMSTSISPPQDPHPKPLRTDLPMPCTPAPCIRKSARPGREAA